MSGIRGRFRAEKDLARKQLEEGFIEVNQLNEVDSALDLICNEDLDWEKMYLEDIECGIFDGWECGDEYDYYDSLYDKYDEPYYLWDYKQGQHIEDKEGNKFIVGENVFVNLLTGEECHHVYNGKVIFNA